MDKRMLLNGTKEIKKSIIKRRALVLIVVLIGIASFTLSGCRYFMKVDFSVLCDKSKVYTVSDLFKFEFDRAYINERLAKYANEETIKRDLGLKIDTHIREMDSGMHNHILFVKDDTIIYDYVYSTLEIEFTETDIWIYPDTVLTAELTRGDYVNAEVIQISVKQ